MATCKFLSLDQFTFIVDPPDSHISPPACEHLRRWQADTERKTGEGIAWETCSNKVYW